MNVLNLVGARPQFIKAAMVGRALRDAGAGELLVHTGQHYDENMSRVFFSDMGIPEPACNLEVGSGSHAYQTGETMQRLERVCNERRPDLLVIYGDTNATLAGALVGAKLCLPTAHIEAGLRSFDRTMPEEVNRIVSDRLSTFLFCPTQTAVDNLAGEGITKRVSNVGDVMFDAVLHFRETAERESRVLETLSLRARAFVLVTIHRDFNTDDRARLARIIEGLAAAGETVVFPAHPRVRKRMESFDLLAPLVNRPDIKLIEPVGYLDMTRLAMAARVIVTDSGGVQKEAFFHRVPCVTVRPSTEWVETVSTGWNRLVDASGPAIADAIADARPGEEDAVSFFGDGDAAGKVVGILCPD